MRNMSLLTGSNVTEINVTSPTYFQEIHQQTDINVTAIFIDAIEKNVIRKS